MSASSESDCCPQSSPTFAAFVLKYLMLFATGIFSTSWIMCSEDTQCLEEVLPNLGCGCQQQNQKTYELAVKSFPPPHHSIKQSVHFTKSALKISSFFWALVLCANLWPTFTPVLLTAMECSLYSLSPSWCVVGCANVMSSLCGRKLYSSKVCCL